MEVQFIARLRSNRGVVVKETGVIVMVKELPTGRYQVYLMNKNNNKVDIRTEYTLVIANHLGSKKAPIRLLAALKQEHSSVEIITMYQKRWGIENIFKRCKQKFNLGEIRVLNYQKFVNLIALIQFAINVFTVTFIKIQKSTHSLISRVLMCYKNFLILRAQYQNLDSFISFMQQALKPLHYKFKHPPDQQNLFSFRQLEKLGPF